MNRREQQKRMQRQEESRQRRAEAEHATRKKTEEFIREKRCPSLGVDPNDPRLERVARLSDYGFKSLSELSREGVQEVYLYGRCSRRSQNLAAAMLGARRFVERMGVRVAYVFADKNRTGKTVWSEIRPELDRAIRKARDRGIPLVFVAPSRIVRNIEYHPKENPNAMPNEVEIGAFMEIARGVQLGTLCDPNFTPIQDEQFIRKLIAQEVTFSNVGRPKKEPKLSREALYRKCWPVLKRCKRLLPDLGYRQIERKVFLRTGCNVSHVTLQKWWEKYLQGTGTNSLG